MIQLLSLLFHLFHLILLFILGWLVNYFLLLYQFIYQKLEAFKGEISSKKAKTLFKEINYFYIQVMPTFFFNIKKERLLTLNGIETLYLKLPLVLRILYLILFTLLIIYCILFITSYLYYYIIIH